MYTSCKFNYIIRTELNDNLEQRNIFLLVLAGRSKSTPAQRMQIEYKYNTTMQKKLVKIINKIMLMKTRKIHTQLEKNVDNFDGSVVYIDVKTGKRRRKTLLISGAESSSMRILVFMK